MSGSCINKKIVLIPSFMPDEKLIQLLISLKKRNFEIVLINDGSSTDKAKIFSRAKSYANVINHDSNMGKGAAIKTGLKYILKTFKRPYTVVTADCDGQHTPEDISLICNAAAQHKNTLVIGSRHMNRNVPLRSRFGNSCTRIYFRMKTGKKIYDTQTGLRAFGSELVSTMISISGTRYEYEINVLLYFVKNNIRIKEIPIHTVYISKNSSSHFKPLKDSIRVYTKVIKYKK